MMSSYNQDNHQFSALVWGGQNPQSPTTGAHQYAAGSGQHAERLARAHEVRAAYELPVLPNPIHEAARFAAEVERDAALRHRNVARDAVIGGVLGAGLMYGMRNRGRR
jgi:hypothetical protein